MGHTFNDGSFSPSSGLAKALDRLDRRIDWERRDRGKGARMRQTLGPVLDLLHRLGAPQEAFRCIQVAGTKGKGSVASLIASGLSVSGACVGLYASPHVERIHERIRIDGKAIEDEALAEVLEAALDAQDRAEEEAAEGAEATWFDVLTAAALLSFQRAGVEWAVVECGLGGRLDSTNAVRAEVAVLTHVDLEHTAVLGDTREAIAAEKAGIIDPESTVVSAVGPPEDPAAAVVARRAAEVGARLIALVQPQEITLEGRNVAQAKVVLAHLGLVDALGEERIREARLPGRLEKRWWGSVPVVLDGAHVPSSLNYVLRDLEADSELVGRPVVILGAGLDKDVEGLLKVLVGRVDRVLCTSLGTGPVLSPPALLDHARRCGLPAEAAADPMTALEMALQSERTDPWVLVTGSLHLIGELRGRLAAERKPGC